MEIPKKLIKKLGEKYRDSSITAFNGRMKRIFTQVFKTNEYDSALLYESEQILDYIKSLAKVSVQKNILSAVVAFSRAEEMPDKYIKEYEAEFKILADQNEALQQYKPPSDEELENFIPFGDVIKIRDNYAETMPNYKIDELEAQNKLQEATKHQKTVYQKYLILSLYTYVPPLRGEDWFNAVIIPVENAELYPTLLKAMNKHIVDVTNNKLVVGTYKTSDKYGTRIIDLPQELVNIINRSFKINNGNPNLLINYNDSKNRPMNEQAFNKFMNKIFQPKNISSSMLRKMYISEKLKEIKTPEERKKLALVMGHSLASQEFTYSRFRDI